MSNQDTGAGSIDQTLRERLEAAWRAGRPEPIERLLPGEDDPTYLPTLEKLISVELESAWKSWSTACRAAETAMSEETQIPPPRVEAYLQRFSRLSRPEIVLRLLRMECAVRRKHGDDVSVDDYRRRFPDLTIDAAQFESDLPTVDRPAGDVRLAETLPHGEEPAGDVRLAETLPPGESATTTTGDTIPDRFGNYQLLGEIGRGGMGIVFRARQQAADRIVALKVVRRDRLAALPRDTQASAIDRFWQEAQAAARLEHDNIVTVYEVGEVDGQPFFSMRYVEGNSLAEILREGPIENRRAAGYMKPVARAVHEAHCRGILHRDLKPQNILVDSKNDRPMVADFGLAKLSEGTDELTRAGEVMGTPSYMSPEQAKDSAQVTAATDTYALGATLYHVLTGRPPFHAATPVETLRQVIDEEPVPPRQLNASIHRDLETICLKCLEKEPARRYGSAELLADDLGRYLRGEPIEARPIGPLGRIVRWCRRNPVTATLVLSTFTFLVLALAGTTIGMVQASLARKQSEESFWELRRAVDNFYTQVSEDTLLNEPGMQPLRKQLLAQARDYYQEFLSQRGDDPSIRDELALTHYRQGRITELIDSPQKALAAYQHARQIQEQLLSEHPDDREHLQALGSTLNAIGTVLHRQGRLGDARDVHREAVRIRAQLVRQAPDETEFQRTLANSYMNIGLIEKEIGIVEPADDRYEEARRQFDKAQAIRRGILRQGHEDPDVRRDLGKGYYNQAVLELAAENWTGARKSFEDAIAVCEDLLQRDPRDLANQYFLALCCRCLADLILAQPSSSTEDLKAALGFYERALGPMKILALANPEVAQYQAELAGLQMNRGALERALQRPAAARNSFEQALSAFQTLVERHPNTSQYLADLAGLQMMLGDLQCQEQDVYSALQSFRGAHDVLRELIHQYPEIPEFRRDLAVTVRQIALLQAEVGQAEAAANNLETLRTHLAELVEQYPGRDDFKALLEATERDLENLKAGRPQDE